MSKIKRQPKEARLYRALLFFLAAFLSAFFSCGIDEYFYLPQVPEVNIQRTFNTRAVINLPDITGYRGRNYTIYYRIYISNVDYPSDITEDIVESISSDLRRDYRSLLSVSNPTTSVLLTSNTFSNLKYFELEFKNPDPDKNEILPLRSILPAGGGTLEIIFPTGKSETPYIRLNNGPHVNLLRFRGLLDISPGQYERYFQNTIELYNYEFSSNYTDSINSVENFRNKDVSGLETLSAEPHAYVSMYIVAVGYNPQEFRTFYSKPTHISIFKLPNNY